MTDRKREAKIKLCYLFAAALLTVIGCESQSPADGHLEKNSYVNSYLHFTYIWPANLQPIDIGNLNIHPAKPNPNEYPLFAARQGGDPFGIVMIAEKLHAPTPHNRTGFTDGANFLSYIVPGFGPDAHVKVLASKHMANPNGFVIDELDYAVANEYDSGIAIQSGQYLVVFKCNAKSPSDLEIMTKSILATKRTH